MESLKNNQELVNQMNLLIDNELPKEAERELLDEIKSNPAIRELLNRERSFREFIKSRIHRRKVSPDVINNVKEIFHA